jgi:hypothetical protein
VPQLSRGCVKLSVLESTLPTVANNIILAKGNLDFMKRPNLRNHFYLRDMESKLPIVNISLINT